MGDRDDELDPSQWLAAQFGEEPPAPTPDIVEPVLPPAAAPPAAPPPAPEPPLPTWSAAAPEPALPTWSGAGEPAVPTWSDAPAAPAPAASPAVAAMPPQPPQPPAPEPAAAPAEQPPAFGSSGGGGFSWGLTPGQDPAIVAATPPPVLPPPVAPPVGAPPVTAPPVTAPPVVTPTAWLAEPSPTLEPPALVPPTLTPPVVAPTTSYDDGPPTQAMPVVGRELQPREVDPSSWYSTPVDSSLSGATEVIEAEIVGLETPAGEGIPGPSGLDALFGEESFQEYDDQIVSAPPPRAPGGSGPKPPKEPSAPLPRAQKILMIVAASLAGVLALVALFALGLRLSDRILPEAEPTPTPTPTPTEEAFALGPVDPGEYQWNELLGGECLGSWEGAWTQTFEVVDCEGAHPAQLVGRGVFDETDFDPYPGFDVLLGRMNTLCTAPTVIDYARATQFADLQIAATVPVDEVVWDDGDRSYFCFVTRSSGADLTGSIAVPAVMPTPTATPTPTGTPPGGESTAIPGGRGVGTAPPKS